ncbi:MAG: hypothetical protein L0Y58_10400 [Verrucomicrobia subdivision 3 bacterium]|nr:hypothetical protein [Limisphaerales bacterium]
MSVTAPRRFGLAWIITFSVILAAIVAFTIWRLSLGWQNKARLKAIADRGEPVDSRALNQSYQAVPYSENAAVLWLRGAGEMTAAAADPKTWSKIKRPPHGTNVSATDIQLVRGLVASNEVALATLHAAAALSKSRYPVDLTPAMKTLLPHLSKMRAIARLLQAEALVAVQDGDAARAVRSVTAILSQSRSLSPEPIPVSQFVSYSIDASAFETAEYVINCLQLADAHLQTLTAVFAAAEDTNGLYRALIGERACFVTGMRDPHAMLRLARAGLGTPAPSLSFQDVVWPFVRASGFFERDFGFGVDALSTNILLARLPDPHRFASHTNWDALLIRARKGRYLLSGVFLSALDNTFVGDVTHRAQHRVAHLALAVERYQRTRGEIPDQHTDLVPEFMASVLIDPFDGQPLRFKPLDSGYVVYSVGPDLRDDGGLEKPREPKEKEPWDLTFIVERHETR